MDADLDTLITALYVKIDDELGGPRWPGQAAGADRARSWCAWRSRRRCWASTRGAAGCGIARKHLARMFPYLPQQSGYNKRLRAALSLVKRVIRMLATVE